MSFYTNRAQNIYRNYIVIKHGIPNVNATLMGVKFRDGWAVVEKDSKTYFNIKKLPMMRNCIEKPLDFLKQLPFITRTVDIKLIYGADVYAKFLTFDSEQVQKQAEIDKVIQEELHLQDETLCRFRLKDGNLCKTKVQDHNISDHCSLHLLKDPMLKEIGVKVPLAMDKPTRRKMRKTAFNKLRAYRKQKEKENVSLDQEKIVTEEKIQN